MTTLVPDPLWTTARADPDARALRSGGVVWTRAELLDAVDSLACSLHAEGIGQGSRVASLLADGWQAVVLIHALRRIRAVAVPLNRRLAAPELAYQLETTAPVALLHDAGHSARAKEVAGPVSSLALEALLAGAPCASGPHLHDDVDPVAEASIVFTSGTTGRPRGAVLTHGNHHASADAWAAVLQPRAGDRWLSCLPLFHVAGLAIVTRAAIWGAGLEVHDRFDAEAVLHSIDQGVTYTSLVAAQFESLLDVRPGERAPSTVRAVLLGGGSTPAALLQRARAAGWPVLTTYGMTETASGLAVGRVEPHAEADAGRPLPGAEIRIERRAGPDDPGEIVVRGPMVFGGYVGAEREALDADGWFHTGDIGWLDDTGRLHISDRRDDLFISGGENVYPAEVEAVLLAHDAVSDAAVLAAADPRWGAVPVAVVVADGDVPDDSLLEYCRARLAAYKVPVRLYRVPQLPRSALGKIRRSELAAELGIQA